MRRRLFALLDAKLVVNVFDPSTTAGNVLCEALAAAVVDQTRKCDFARADGDVEVARIEIVIVGERFADILADTLVRTVITTRAPAPKASGTRGTSAYRRQALRRLVATCCLLLHQPRPSWLGE
jgi:hypothetical protein